MQNPSKSVQQAQRFDAQAYQQVMLHSRLSGESSPALEGAFRLVGAQANITPIPQEILRAEGIDGTGLLLRGRQATVVWCSSGSLETIGRIAAKFNCGFAASWSGIVDLKTPVPNPGKSTTTRFQKLFGLLLIGLALAVGVTHADEDHSTPPLVRSSVALGANLLERIGTSAAKAGYRTEIADVRADSGGIQLVLPGLVLIPPTAPHPKTIRLPIVIALGGGEKLLFTCHAITRPADPLPDGSAVRIVLRHVADEKVIVEKSTTLSRGWSTPNLEWVADRDWPAGEFVVEIIPAFAGPLKVTLPQGLILPAIKQ